MFLGWDMEGMRGKGRWGLIEDERVWVFFLGGGLYGVMFIFIIMLPIKQAVPVNDPGQGGIGFGGLIVFLVLF